MKRVKSEGGQAFILVLLFLLVGGLLLPPLLSLSMTGLKTGQMYESKTEEVYSADSGLEHALWQIKYGELESFLTTSDPPGISYSIYDFSTKWDYSLSESLNDKSVSVSLENVWIPMDIDRPDTPFEIQEAKSIIEAGKLIVIGGASGTSLCQINIVFYPGAGDELNVETLGVWLSPGFEYVADSSSFGQPSTQPHAGGQALLWDFESTPFVDFPGVDPDETELRSTITFQFTASQENSAPATVSWITTSGVSDVPYTWDADSRVYHVTSVSGDTTVESYNVKNELRKLGSAISGDYRAIGNSLMLDEYGDWGGPRRDTLLAESSAAVSDIPSDAMVEAAYLYWTGWFEGGDDNPASGQIVWEDNCSNMSNWNGAGPDWNSSWGEFRGHHNGGESDRYLTMKYSLNLSEYSGDNVTLSWEQDEEGWLESDDRLYFSVSADGGSTWSSDIEAFRDDSPPDSFSYTIPAEYLTANFKMRFYLYGFSGYGEYCYIDNITVFAVSGAFLDSCNNFNNWNAGTDWSLYWGEFRGHHSWGSGADRYLTLQSSLDLSSYSSGELALVWEQHENGSLESTDRLYFALSANGGSTWSSDIEAFRDDNPPSEFSYTIPDEYLTANFKMRFYLYGFSSGGEYCYLDNIAVAKRAIAGADTTAIFKIDGTQVYFTDGTPTQGAGVLVADSSQVIDNMYYGNPHGYSYSSFKDVTELVRAFCAEDEGQHPGNGTYTVGGVDADIGDEWSFAGWSLIIIYSSPETEGHQLYLYDEFLYCASYENLDFDGDGEPGGILSGFLVPQPITGETNAATMTCFVAEGDDYYDGDYFALNGTKLWDGTEGESLNDVWNGQSVGMTADGVDVDTFYITWASGLLETGNTSAQIDIVTDIDIWNLVYIILSFRSEVTTSDSISYSIGFVSGS